MSRHFHNRPHHHRKGDKVLFGLMVVLVGVFLLLKKLHLFYFDWHSFWPVILIAIGLFIGVQKRFTNNAWWILILIGTAYLIPEFEVLGTSSSALVFPAALILGGLMMILRPGKKNSSCSDSMQVVTSSENVLNIDVTFGGRKEIVTSKEFRGGRITTTFGGTEVSLVQADSKVQPMVLDMKVSFGAVELVVPSHWELQNEIEPTLGSVEDHRSIHTAQPVNEDKRILILRGTCSFGSIEIKSY